MSAEPGGVIVIDQAHPVTLDDLAAITYPPVVVSGATPPRAPDLTETAVPLRDLARATGAHEDARHDWEPGEVTHPMRSEPNCRLCGAGKRALVHG